MWECYNLIGCFRRPCLNKLHKATVTEHKSSGSFWNIAKYIKKIERNRENSKNRKKCLSTKRRRNEIKKIHKSSQNRKERKEGTTYRSGIGLELISEEEIHALSVSDKKLDVEKFLEEKIPVKNPTS